ncbi:unnamed protein product [Lepeophtheirus salmonis]|uniref:(salmon louse) hypothetical protein n=1 Tax=Lepeophtheirus salmonis TaxID=72036 RepID=A0A7R8CZB0_LEPSM|nr:unnamed protein product [Lepeophtheirus salmonis]CAF2974891.1 unnamed protein product [Lepeophtheirus salmonis]
MQNNRGVCFEDTSEDVCHVSKTGGQMPHPSGRPIKVSVLGSLSYEVYIGSRKKSTTIPTSISRNFLILNLTSNFFGLTRNSQLFDLMMHLRHIQRSRKEKFQMDSRNPQSHHPKHLKRGKELS